MTAPRPAPAATAEISGRPVVLTYSSIAAEYEALRTGTVITDRSHRGRTRMTGEKAAEVMAGLVTSDVGALTPGTGTYAAALTPKGRIVADARIFATGDGLLADVPARARDGWTTMLRKFVNPRLAKITDESESLRTIGVYGPTSHHVVAAMLEASDAALGALAEYAFITAAVSDERVIAARVPDLGVQGFDVFAPAALADGLWQRALDAGAVPAGLEACEIARVEAGRPEWGIDMDDATIPQEANMDELRAISYTKGCYTGQEVVARIHFRGHVNRHLRGLRGAGSAPPPAGARLVDTSGTDVGDVRSAVASPRLGGIAIAMIRREVESGAALVARAGDAECRVDVVALPFPD